MDCPVEPGNGRRKGLGRPNRSHCEEEELLASSIAGLIRRCAPCRGRRNPADPGSGGVLGALSAAAGGPTPPLGSRRQKLFTDGRRAVDGGQGDDAFFLSGGTSTAKPRTLLERWRLRVSQGVLSRLFGSAHPPTWCRRRSCSARQRTLVERVDFVSAPGASADNVHRPGGPFALITNRCLFAFDRRRRRFTLTSVHPGHSVAEVEDNTGFAFDRGADVPATPLPRARTCVSCARWWRRSSPRSIRSSPPMCSGCDNRPDPPAAVSSPRQRHTPVSRVRRGGARVPHRIVQCLSRPHLRGTAAWVSGIKGKARATSRSRSDRHRLVRGHPRGDAVALRAGGQAAHLRNPPGSPRRGQGAHPARDRDARLPRHHQEPEHFRGLYQHHAGAEPLPDYCRDRLKAGKHVLLEKPIAMELWEADELITLARRGRLKFDHRLFAAVQHQVRLCQEDHRRHARQGGLGDGEPASGRGLGAKIAKRVKPSPAAMEFTDDLDFCVLAAGARQAGAGLFPRAPMATCSRSTAPTTSCGRS